MFTFWSVSLFTTVILYGLLVDLRMLYIWIAIFTGYHTLGFIYGGSNPISNRSKIRLATWNPPSDPNCYGKLEVNLEKVSCLLLG